MTRRFTVIQGGLAEGPGTTRPRGRPLPVRARLEAVGAALRRRLAALPRSAPSRRAGRTGPAPARSPIPAAAFLGIRPEGWERDVA